MMLYIEQLPDNTNVYKIYLKDILNTHILDFFHLDDQK